MVHLEVTICDLKADAMAKSSVPAVSSPAWTEFRVIEVRGERVILDHDVARLFGTETKKLNQQISRNADKFGEDFSFRLNKEEFDILRSQNVTSRWLDGRPG